GPILKLVDFSDTPYQADLSSRNRFADADAGQQQGSLFLERITPERCRFALRLDSLRACLNDIQVAAVAIFGPLNVHWPAIVPLDHSGPACQLQNFLIIKHERTPFEAGGVYRLGGLAATNC